MSYQRWDLDIAAEHKNFPFRSHPQHGYDKAISCTVKYMYKSGLLFVPCALPASRCMDIATLCKPKQLFTTALCFHEEGLLNKAPAT